MNKVKLYRERRKLTQSALGNLLGVDRTTVGKWESGIAKPRADMLIKMAKLFHCKVDAILNS